MPNKITHDRITAEARSLGQSLRDRGLTLVTAESCTGGWIAKVLTDVPGSSAWFEAGWVTYSDGAKAALLGVQAATLDRFGAVSRETVTEMAAGALDRWPDGALSVAVSGVAGPDGGTVDKPVGFVWFAWGDRRGADLDLQTDVMRFAGDREAVRAATVLHALEGVARRL